MGGIRLVCIYVCGFSVWGVRYLDNNPHTTHARTQEVKRGGGEVHDDVVDGLLGHSHVLEEGAAVEVVGAAEGGHL
jgi:hypothetical protein